MQMEIYDCLTILLLVVFVLVTAVSGACSVLENGIKYTARKIGFWCITGVVLSILAVAAVIWICKVHGENMQNVTLKNTVSATGHLAVAFSCLFYLVDDSPEERER